MAKILIVYATTEGQTKKIARFIGRNLVEKGHLVCFSSIHEVQFENELSTYDAFIIGSSVHISRFNKELQKWVCSNADGIRKKPSAFFSVCLGILEKNSKANQDEKNIVEEFFYSTKWRPNMEAIFAGALKYSKYGWFKKKMMQRISKKAGGDTDTKYDYEYTNWDDVNNFVERFNKLLIREHPQLGVSFNLHWEECLR